MKWEKSQFCRNVTIPPCRFEADPNAEPDDRTALSYFYDFFSEECFDLIVHETNLYSMQLSGTPLNVDKNAIKGFIGIQLLMGIIDLPAITDFWSRRFRQQTIADVMSLKKFLKIRRFIHFANNEDQDDDPFFKIRPIAELVRRNCINVPPEKKYSVDEMMVPYKGSKAGSKKQYMPKKPCKWGFKLFVRSGISGIVYDFFPYCGSSSFRGIDFTPKEEAMSFSAQIVLALCKSIQDPPLSTVFCDNFFTSLSMMVYLREEFGILALGTIRANRTSKAPLLSEKEIKKKGRGWYEEYSDNKKNIALIQWMDSKPVLLTSTFVSADPVEKILRWSKADRAKVEVDCPQIVKEYNRHMGGVDLSDMLISLYRTPFRSHRWYLPLFAQLLDICTDNAWLMYRRNKNAQKGSDMETNDDTGSSQKEKKKNTSTLSLKDFRADIAEQLIRDTRRKKGASKSLFIKSLKNGFDRSSSPSVSGTGKFSPKANCSQAEVQHFPSYTKKGKCRECHKNQTTVYCEICDKRLCFVPKRNCYLSYHGRL